MSKSLIGVGRVRERLHEARRVKALMAVPAAMLAGAIGARVALARPPVKAWTDLAQPLPVVTAWGTLGLVPFAWLAFAVAAGACAIVSTWGRPAARGPSLRLTLACAALTLAAALAWPVVFSSDVYAYAAYGDAMLHGLDPYAAPAPTMHDAFFDAARWQWGGATFPACVYGPAFVALATLLTAASAGHVAIALWIFRLAACAAFLGSIVAFDRALQRNERRRLAVAAYALNPVALWSAAEGHNDAFVLLFVMTAFALMRSRTTIAGFALGFAAAFKAVALAVPGLVLFSRAEGSSAYRRFALATLGGVALAIAIALPVQVHALRGSGGAPSAPQFSVPFLFGAFPVALAVIALGSITLRTLRREGTAGLPTLAIAAWIAIPNPYPWYALWVVPAASLGLPGTAAFALWAATISGLLRYLPEAYGTMGYSASAALTIAQYAPLALVPLVRELHRRSKKA